MHEVDDPAGYWSAGRPPSIAGLVTGPGGAGPAPGGRLSGVVGPAATPDDLEQALQTVWDGLADDDEVERVRRHGRAFAVRPLMGLTVEAADLGDLGPSLARALEDALGGPWPRTVRPGPLEKYRILHEIVPAPPDAATGEPMLLELYGDVAAELWPDARVSRGRDPDELLALPSGAVHLTIRSAWWANFHRPGLGVPFYF